MSNELSGLPQRTSLAQMPKEDLEELRRQTIREAGEACIQWHIDTDDCHFCNPILGEHEEHCPLREYFGALRRYRKSSDVRR